MKNILLLFIIFTLCSNQVILSQEPTAICQNNTIISVFNNQPTRVEARQFNGASYDDGINDARDLKYSFSSDINDSVRIFTCPNIPESITVMMHVFDEDNNHDVDTTEVKIKNYCNTSNNIKGTTDKTAPVMVLHQALEVTNIDSIAFFYYTAKDFNTNTRDNTSETYRLKYAFDPDFKIDTMFFHCDDEPKEMPLTVYCKDEAGNVSWIDVSTIILDMGCESAFQPDTTAPIARCKPNFSASIAESTLEAKVIAEHMNENSSDKTTPKTRLRYSFSNTDPNDTLLTFNCDDLGEQEVTLNVFDHEGNVGQCTTTITIQDPSSVCPAKDTKAPSAICQNVTVEIKKVSSEKRAEVTIQMINNGSNDETTSNENLFLSFDEGSKVTSVTFDCSKVGKQEITLYVEDEAGNKSSCVAEVEIIDPKSLCNEAPVAICVGSITNDLQMDNAYIAKIKASDFNDGSSDDHTSQVKLKFAFSNDINDTIKTYTCDDLDNSSELTLEKEITLHVFDEEGLSSTCTSKVKITNLDKSCISSTKEENLHQIDVYPNPFTEVIIIENIPTNLGNLIVKVNSINGKIIARKEVSTSSMHISLKNEVARGVYIISIEDEKGTLVAREKIIK